PPVQLPARTLPRPGFRSTRLSPSLAPPLFSAAPPTTPICTLSLHDALPICRYRVAAGRLRVGGRGAGDCLAFRTLGQPSSGRQGDRKSTRLNSSHVKISYAVFCLKKKRKLLVSDPITAAFDDEQLVVPLRPG